MSRRILCVCNTWAVLILSYAMDCVQASEAVNRLESRPNIVFMVADDLGWAETGCYGQSKIPTPNIDRLAREGVRFTQHYSGAPVCAPSRCVLLTGKHLGHSEIRGNQQAKVAFPNFDEGQHPLTEDAKTFVQLFQEAGYATGGFGKWGLGPVGSTGEPNRKGFDLFYGYNCQSVAHSYYPAFLWRNRDKVPLNHRPISGHQKLGSEPIRADQYLGEKYAPLAMIEEAEKFLEANHHRPFFLYLPFIEPHLAMHPPKEYVDRFPDHWDEQPYLGENDYLAHPRPRAAYAGMISSLDDQVGRILNLLDKYSLAENTLVVFTSDNGTTHAGNGTKRFHVGGVDAEFFESTAHLRGYKGSLNEGGIRVPMIARWPQHVPVGAECDYPSYFADWFPTLCEIMKWKQPTGLQAAGWDGQSIWKQLQGNTEPVARKPMVWVFPEYGGQVAVRFERYKVIRQGLKTRQPGSWEVYDILQDPSEANDLSKSHSEWIDRAIEVLKSEVAVNSTFPVPIPELR